MGIGKDEAPPPPDYSDLATSSMEVAKLANKLGRDQFNWARQQYLMNKQTTDFVLDKAMDRLERSDAWAEQDRNRYQNIYQPLEDEAIDDAKKYSSEAFQEQQAGKASADVANQFNSARTNAMARLESFGIDPGQVRMAALDVSSRAAQGAAQAGASNMARDRTDAMGKALRSEAINVGRGYPGQVAGTYNTALNSGNQAIQGGVATTNAGTAGAAAAAPFLGTSASASNGAIGGMAGMYNAQVNGVNANNSAIKDSWGTAGSIIGFGGTMAGKFFAEGGDVEGMGESHDGLTVPPSMSPSGGQQTDDVRAQIMDGGQPVAPAAINVGEFIIPKDVVEWRGESHYQRDIMKARKEKESAVAKPQIGPAPQAIPVG